eukprot:gene108-biopygen292
MPMLQDRNILYLVPLDGAVSWLRCPRHHGHDSGGFFLVLPELVAGGTAAKQRLFRTGRINIITISLFVCFFGWGGRCEANHAGKVAGHCLSAASSGMGPDCAPLSGCAPADSGVEDST